MKGFLGTFIICFILIYVFLLFGGAFIFENIWAILVVIALAMAILITIFINQEAKLEELEERIKKLESGNELEE